MDAQIAYMSLYFLLAMVAARSAKSLGACIVFGLAFTITYPNIGFGVSLMLPLAICVYLAETRA